MRFCKRCVYPENHPLGIVFDSQGVCSGCRIHEEKDRLDWKERTEILKNICREFRSKQRYIHDCIIPVSGARDSYFIVHFVKNVLGMHPLLVNYNRHYNTKIGIRNLAYLRSLMGVDIVHQTINPDVVKKITRESLRLRGSIYWHCLAGSTVFPVHMAVKLKIPLIIWGVHQGIDQVGMYSHLDEVEMTRKYRKEHDLMGLEAEDLASNSDFVSESDVEPYRYPNDKEIAAVGVRGIYLNNYIRWDSKAQHEEMIRLYGYETMCQQRTFDTYSDVDCWHYSGLHDYIKFLKWGYGKASDHAAREIRLKRMTRENAIAVVSKYHDKIPKDLDLFLEWIGMSEQEFWKTLDEHRNPNVWHKENDGSWVLLDSILSHEYEEGLDEVRLDAVDNCEFELVPWRDPDVVEDGYVLVGRGWVDKAGKTGMDREWTKKPLPDC